MPVGFDNLTPFFSIVFAVNLDIDSGAFVLLAFVTGTHRMDDVQGSRQHCCWTLPPSGSFAQLHYVEVAQRYLTCWCEESLGSNEQVEALDQETKANRYLPFELLVHFLDLPAAWVDLIIRDSINSSIAEWLHELTHHSTLATHWPLAGLFAASLSLSANNHNLRPPDISRTSEALAILMVVVFMVLLCYAYN